LPESDQQLDVEWVRTGLRDAVAAANAGDELTGISWWVDRELLPIFDESGLVRLQQLLSESGSDPWIANALAIVVSSRDLDPSAIFSDTSVLAGCVTYLRDGYSFEHRWAWIVLCLGGFDNQRRAQLSLQLAHAVADDEVALWMIGDGPIASIEDRPGGVALIRALAASDALLARIKHLVVGDTQ
jgi:hypothetical protein